MNGTEPLLTRLGGVDVLSWDRLTRAIDEAGARLTANFGDLIGPMLVERIAGTTAIHRELAHGSDPQLLLSVGSILHFAPPKAVVWGSGINFKLASKLPADVGSLDIRAVRGPHTARALTSAGVTVPSVFGDPALLLPRYMPELDVWRRNGRGGIVVVPNLNDYAAMSSDASSMGYSPVNPCDSFRRVLRSIAESDLVVGSSLHAIVIADALGIPARFVASASEGPWKYWDYLAGTGRPLELIASDLEDAIDMGGHAAIDFDIESLLDAFPHDLWGTTHPGAKPTIFRERIAVLNTWKRALTGPGPSAGEHAATFSQEMFPRIVHAARSLVDASDVPEADSNGLTFNAQFADTFTYRMAFAAGVTRQELNDSDGPLLTALDSGQPSVFLRGVWLQREGAHALLRSVTRSNGVYIFSMVLRPGTLVNTIETIEVAMFDQRQNWTRTISVPVFEMYRKQWTIDLCVAVDLPHDAHLDGMYIRLTDESANITICPVREGTSCDGDFRNYPRVAEAPRWRGIDESASFIGNESWWRA